jgi:hypothetical protein
MLTRKTNRTGRPAFGNPTRRSEATLYRMGASRRLAKANRWTGRLVRYTWAMSARTL